MPKLGYLLADPLHSCGAHRFAGFVLREGALQPQIAFAWLAGREVVASDTPQHPLRLLHPALDSPSRERFLGQPQTKARFLGIEPVRLSVGRFP